MDERERGKAWQSPDGRKSVVFYNGNTQYLKEHGKAALWYEDGIWSYLRTSASGDEYLVQYEGAPIDVSGWTRTQ